MSPVIPELINHYSPNNLDIVRFLVAESMANELGISADYSQHLANASTWQAFKDNLPHEISLLKNENDKLTRKEEEIDASALVDIQKTELKKQHEETRFANTKKINQFTFSLTVCEKVDALLQSQELQEYLLVKLELIKYYSNYLALEKQALATTTTAELQELREKMELLVKKDHHLADLLKEIQAYQYKNGKPKIDSHGFIENVFFGNEVGDSVLEITDKSKIYAEQLRGVDQAEAGDSRFFATIPVISSFISGLHKLHDAYMAYKNPKELQRKTKIAAGIFGGLVFIGSGIVGALLLAGAGLLGTAAAVWIAPIVLTSAAIGVAAVSLYRDSYVLHQARQQVDEVKKALETVEQEFIRAKEIIISNHLMHLSEENMEPHEVNEIKAIKEIQVIITQKRHELFELIKLPNKSPDKILQLKNELTNLGRQRNELINNNSKLTTAIQKEFRNDPRIARIHVQKNNLTQSLEALRQARSAAKVKVVLSTLGVIAVGLALSAILLTGIGAVVVGVVSVAAVAVITAKSVQMKAEQVSLKKDAASKEVKKATPIHSSELKIEKELLHNQHAEVVHALIHQVVKTPVVATAVNKEKPIAPAVVALKPVLTEKEKEEEGEGEKKKFNH